jgi:hypothetical protein
MRAGKFTTVTMKPFFQKYSRKIMYKAISPLWSFVGELKYELIVFTPWLKSLGMIPLRAVILSTTFTQLLLSY